MNKPRWQIEHDQWIDDIKDELSEIWRIKLILRAYPHGKTGDGLRESLRLLNSKLTKILYEYKKIYGHRPNIREMKKEVEIE